MPLWASGFDSLRRHSMMEFISILDIATILAASVDLALTVWLWIKVDDVEDDIEEMNER